MNNSPDYSAALEDFKRGGWITGLFGLGGMLVRLLITDEKSTVVMWVRKIIASVITGVLAYFALWGADMPGIYKSVILATSGMFCPEIVERLRKEYVYGGKTNKKKRN